MKEFRIWKFVSWGVVLIGLSVLLAWLSSGFEDIQSWGLFFATNLIAIAFLLSGWFAIKADKSIDLPNLVGWLMLGAVLIRLFAGGLWYAGLPSWGYGTEVEQAGYIMADAHARDTAAWQLAQSEKSLLTAFSEYRYADQYGGMIYLSGVIYRYLGGVQHFSIQMTILTASFSALAILFTWAFAKRLWGEKVALLAAWIMALFPDAIILGSSQMREAFLMTFVAAALYGLVRYIQDRTWSGLAWLVSGLLLMLLFSPPIAGVFLVMIIIIALSMDGWQGFRQPRFWLILAGIALVAGLGMWLAWERIAPEGINNPIALVNWWFRESARWQAYFVKRSSPLIRRIFNTTPDWIHTPILLGYGVLQPFLPGAILDQGAPFWKVVAIWRALGWTILLPLILVAPILLFREKKKRRFAVGLLIVVWMSILIAALRSGGDLWDNPRYRVVFISLQVGLVAWVYNSQQESKNPWMWRTIIGLVILLAWFVPWYLQRSEQLIWPISNVFVTFGLGLLSAGIYLFWMYRRGRNKGEVSVLYEDSPADED